MLHTLVLLACTTSQAPVLPPAGVSFDTYRVYRTDASPYDSAAGDLDGDGDLDVAITHSNGHLVLLWNDGTGELPARTILTTSGGTRGIALADLDADGDLDVASAGSASGAVFVYSNTGAGTFAGPMSYTSGQGTLRLAVDDVDADGKLDIVATNLTGQSVSVLIGHGDGTFAAPVVIPVSVQPTAVVLRDFDGDGALDIATGGGNPATSIVVLRGQGGGAFGPETSWPVAASPSSIAAGDLDGDGDVDLAVGCTGHGSTDHVTVLRNDGAASFASAGSYTVANLARLEIGDVDGDGDLDVAAARTDNDRIDLLLNDGTGTLTAGLYVSRDAPTEVTIADLDGDQRDDLFATSSTSWGSSVHLNDGGARFPLPSYEPTGLPATSGSLAGGIVNADFDGDGVADLAVWRSAAASVAVVLGNGDGGFTPASMIGVGGTASGLAVGDVDGDGDADLVVTVGSLTTAVVLANDGSAHFAQAAVLSVSSAPGQPALADLDGDGDLDLMLAETANRFSVALNDGAGGFGALAAYATSGAAGAVRVADLDRDGDLDIVVRSTSSGGGRVQVFTNAGNGTFVAGQFVAPNNIALGGPELADVDGDGDPDIVRWWSDPAGGNARLVVDRNVGNGTFGPGYDEYGLEAYPTGFALADFDRDGDVDVAICNLDASVSLWTNNGGGTFARAGAWGLRQICGGFTALDVEADGDDDVVFFESSLAEVGVLRNGVRTGSVLCAGDGSATACPCGNASAPGAGVGCLSSLGLGGSLRARGVARLSQDRLVLEGSAMPDSSALYFQGTTPINAGAGSVFGDGLRCAGGSVLRLGIRVNAGGASSYPSGGAPGIRDQGAITASGTRVYQVWYRNSAAFCTTAVFNLTNGLSVAWTP